MIRELSTAVMTRVALICAEEAGRAVTLGVSEARACQITVDADTTSLWIVASPQS